MKVCLASIIGRPNVGKSSLINKIVKYDVAIVTNVPQTTRDQIVGVYNEDDFQLVFVDTPGIHKPLNLLGESLNKSTYESTKEVDCLLFLSPVNEKIGQGDILILNKIKDQENKIAVISKIDLAKNPDEIKEKIEELKRYNFDTILSVSANDDKSVESLIKVIKKYAYDGEPFYDQDYITDKSLRFIAKEIIRESAINLLREELPHSIAVEVLEFIEDEDIKIDAIIYVKKASQKGMVIGKQGQMIKQIGTNARKKMMSQFDAKVQLNLKVKIANKWINDIKILKKFGYE
ncbi:GTPase Era [Mycoplasmopsis caviae]|uniref:GTPase Era n=1 Tax=Mycoplasmopsis caviae TaxID=55603 RepID=A0A3P8K915_9BACT|nr:GTPase Era [Mycoplasmopsis caviae]UUD35341.1 GTPase Era [Mycoplasmopsis caviae]VDR41879.1 GTP-binding protein [Mycoplasmopsis caviae]